MRLRANAGMPGRTISVAITLGVLFMPGVSLVRAQEGFLEAPVSYDLNVLAVTYGRGETEVTLESTHRLPDASGRARVERKDGVTRVAVELDEMKPAWSFGGDFSTYVLWAVSPEGHLDNIGEFILKGDNSTLIASTATDTFGLIVTAEPHFMVEAPSPFLVLANREPNRPTPRPTSQVDLRIVYSATPYRYEMDSLVGAPDFDGETRSELRQAQIAVLLAEQAGAGHLAPEAFEAARDALLMTEGAAETRSPTDEDVQLMARRTVRLATTAERMAIAQERAIGDTAVR